MIADLLKMKQDSNERNRNCLPDVNINGNEFVSSQKESKNFIRVKHFQDEIKFLRKEVGNKNEIIKTFKMLIV